MYQYVSSQVSSSGGMFRRRGNDLLPVASGTRQTGLRASEVMTAPKISGGQKVSLVVFVISMLFVVTGYLFCASNRKLVTLECVRGADCALSVKVNDAEFDKELAFPASALKGAGTNRMRKGVVQDTTGMKRRRQRKLQHGYHVTWTEAESGAVNTEQMVTWNLGRKRPKSQVAVVENWIQGDEATLSLQESTFVSVTGIIFMCIGGVGALLSLLIGCILDDGPAKRPRRRYQPRKAKY